MKVMAFNGSPRKKNWNTVTLLTSALEGAVSVGADTELIQLYDLSFLRLSELLFMQENPSTRGWNLCRTG